MVKYKRIQQHFINTTFRTLSYLHTIYTQCTCIFNKYLSQRQSLDTDISRILSVQLAVKLQCYGYSSYCHQHQQPFASALPI